MQVTADFKNGRGAAGSHRRLSGDLVKENALTVWMRLPNGKIVKRHRTKHRVE